MNFYFETYVTIQDEDLDRAVDICTSGHTINDAMEYLIGIYDGLYYDIDKVRPKIQEELEKRVTEFLHSVDKWG